MILNMYLRILKEHFVSDWNSDVRFRCIEISGLLLGTETGTNETQMVLVLGLPRFGRTILFVIVLSLGECYD